MVTPTSFYLKADVDLRDSVLRGLASLPRQISNAQAKEALIYSGFEVARVEPLDSTGTFHELFDCEVVSGRRFVLKANRISAVRVDTSFLSEAAISRVLAAADIAHARTAEADCSRQAVPFDFLLMDRVVGISLRTIDSDEAAVVDTIPLLARYLKRLHCLEGREWGPLEHTGALSDGLVSTLSTWSEYLTTRLDEHLSIVKGADLVSAAELDEVQSVLRASSTYTYASSSRLLHGDCGPQNVLVDDSGRLVMIDWEDALLGDPLFDVAMWATFQPERRWRTFFDEYYGPAWQPDALFWAYFLRISLSKSVVRIRFNYQNVSGRAPASLRIQRALTGLRSL